MRIWCSYFMLLLSVLFTACSASLDTFNTIYYEHENMEESYKYAQKEASKDLLWAYQSGIAAFNAGQYDLMLKNLDVAEILFEKNRSDFLSSGMSGFMKILTGFDVGGYRGFLYEASLINYYKGLSLYFMRDRVGARVEFNRANDRQNRMLKDMEEYINKAREVSKDSSKDSSITSSEVDNILKSNYSNIDNFRIYDGYKNPLISYVTGIFFLIEEDYAKSMNLLKESYGISPDHRILQDIELLESRKSLISAGNTSRYSWIIIEEGSAPQRVYKNIYLYLANRFVWISLPNLDQGKRFHNNFHLKRLDKGSMKQDEIIPEITNLLDIAYNEFKSVLPYETSITLASVFARLIASVALDALMGALSGSYGGYSSPSVPIITQADIRTITSLPLRQMMLRVKNTDFPIEIYSKGKHLIRIDLKENIDKDNILYLRAMNQSIFFLNDFK